MTVGSVLATGPRSARTRSLAVIPLILLHAHFGLISLSRAEDLGDHQIVDMSSVTCGDFERFPLPRALVAIGWVGGFYAGLKNDTRVDIPVFVDKAERVMS